MLTFVKRLAAGGFAFLFPGTFKHRSELKHWKTRYIAENGLLSNSHFEPLFTDLFDLQPKDFNDKRVLDIGCGPRGSLEWADMTIQRVGLDPLVPAYLRFGADKHKMEYVASRSEEIPFPDGHFDIVACLNALDHVDNIDATILEIKRITKRGGFFLLSVEIEHPPTSTEPITINDDTLQMFSPEFDIVNEFRVGAPSDHNLHGAVLTRFPPYVAGQPGVFVARYIRK